MSNYWQKREYENILRRMAEAEKISAEIAKKYLDSFENIQKEIDVFFSIYADKEGISIGEAKKAARKMDVEKFAKKAAKYVKDKDFSQQANDELRLYNLTMKVNRLELLKANIALELIATSDDLDKYFYQVLQNRANQTIISQAGILGQSVWNDQKVVQQVINSSFYNATFSQRIWSNMDQLQSEISRLLTKGITAGRNPKQLSADLRNLVIYDPKRPKETAQYIADRLLLTEMARVQGAIQMESFNRWGYEWYDIIPEPTACEKCKEIANNGPYEVKKAQVSINMYPFHTHCQCSAVPNADKEYQELKDKMNNKLHESGARRSFEEQEEIANKLYEQIRNRSSDVRRVANHSGMSEEDIRRVYNHLFKNEYELTKGKVRFDPDYEIAQSWQRLFIGNEILDHDLTLLRHELLEETYMSEYNMDYKEAHNKANQKYNYEKELGDYLKGGS